MHSWLHCDERDSAYSSLSSAPFPPRPSSSSSSSSSDSAGFKQLRAYSVPEILFRIGFKCTGPPAWRFCMTQQVRSVVRSHCTAYTLKLWLGNTHAATGKGCQQSQTMSATFLQRTVSMLVPGKWTLSRQSQTCRTSHGVEVECNAGLQMLTATSCPTL
jgi:hypothetical protein